MAITGKTPTDLRIGVVSGRRRVGKSYLLRTLADAADGLYVSAVAEEAAPAARARFATAIARYAGVGVDLVNRDASWETLLETAIDRDWLRWHLAEVTDESTNLVASTVVNDRAGRARHEVTHSCRPGP